MQLYSVNDPRHWRDRAEEVRLLAEEMKDRQARETMLIIARDYERLAQRAAQSTTRDGATHAYLA
jgi:hypothetical protein